MRNHVVFLGILLTLICCQSVDSCRKLDYIILPERARMERVPNITEDDNGNFVIPKEDYLVIEFYMMDLEQNIKIYESILKELRGIK